MRELEAIASQGIHSYSGEWLQRQEPGWFRKKYSFALEVHQETRKGGWMNKEKEADRNGETQKERKTTIVSRHWTSDNKESRFLIDQKQTRSALKLPQLSALRKPRWNLENSLS